VNKASCRMADWTPSSSSSSTQQCGTGANEPWMFNMRYCPYLYCMKDDRDDDVLGYEPAFVECSTLFMNHRQRAGLHDDVTRSDSQKDMWTVNQYQSLPSQRRQQQMNYASQYTYTTVLCIIYIYCVNSRRRRCRQIF